MYLQNGDFIKVSQICYLSIVKTRKGEHRWNATMTKELVEPDTYYIDVKIQGHEMRLEYDDKDDALREYKALTAGLVG